MSPVSTRGSVPQLSPLMVALRRALLGAGLALTVAPSFASPPAPAPHTAVQRFQVPAGTLAQALDALARQAGVSIAYDVAQLDAVAKHVDGLNGEYSLDGGLEVLLAGTGLEVLNVPEGRIVRLRRQTSDPLSGQGSGADATLAEVTVLGTSLAVDVMKYPGSVTVVDDAALDGTLNVIEALGRVPGVATGSDSGRSIGSQYTVRGFGYGTEDRVIVLHDGVRRSSSLYANQISTFRSDNDLLKRIEVVKGASAVSHGGGAIGGVIGMATKDARDFLAGGEERGVAMKLGYQSNNYREMYIAGALAPSDQPYELLVYGKRARVGDLRLARKVDKGSGVFNREVHNQEDLEVGFIKAAWSFPHGQRVALSYYDYAEETEVTWQTLYHSEYSQTTGPVLGTLRQRDVVASYTLQPGSPWVNVSAMAYHAVGSYDRGYEYILGSGATRKLDYENKDTRRGVRLNNQMYFDALGARHRLLVGMDYEHRKEDASYVLDGVATVFGSMPNTYRDLGLFVQEEASFLDDRVVVHLGGRYDRFRRKVDANAGEYGNSHFSPRVGVSVAVGQGWQLLGNYSESFRAPTPHETSSSGPLNIHYYYLPNPDLKPEIVREFEWGVSFDRRDLLAEGDRARMKATYFEGTIENLIKLTPDLTGPTPPQSNYYATYENVDEVQRRGYEITAAYSTRRAGVDISYEHLTQRDQASRQFTPQAFADRIRLGFHFRPLETLRVNVDVSHWRKPEQNPETTVSGGRTYWYVRDDYTQVNLGVRWVPQLPTGSLFGKEVEVAAGINNVFDRPYLNARDVETTTRVGKGRNAYVSVSSRF